jgi:SAM-dependent methyltransferase
VDEATFIRYLEAKRTVDDRALNRRVWEAMIAGVAGAAAGAVAGGWSPRVLEVGGGIGTMVQRVMDGGRLHPRSWTLVDSQPALLAEAARRLDGIVTFPVERIAMELDAYIDSEPDPFDLVVANAVLDLFQPARILPRMARLGRAGGLFLFSITFDGLTVLEPEIDADLDRRIIALYHASMDERSVDGKPAGDSLCGRHLLTLLPRLGYQILAAGPSDWVVYPREGAYPADEEFFLSSILDFFEESLSSRPELRPGELSGWLSRRRAQLRSRQLVFIAHQLDVLAEGPGAGGTAAG